MRQPKVIVAGLTDALLSQIVAETLGRKLGVEVELLEPGMDRHSIEREAVRHEADVIIMELSNKELPQSCNRILERLPGAIIAGVTCDEDETDGTKRVRIVQHALQSDDLGPDTLANIVLAAMQSSLVTQETPETTN